MSNQKIAYRYAKALLDLARENQSLDEIHEDMLLLKSVCLNNRDFKLMLLNPIIPHGKKHSILKDIFEKKVHKITNSFISILTNKNRENILESIVMEFNNLYNIHKGIDEVSVTTTFELDNSMKAEFLEKIKNITGKKVILYERIDKSIIGGYILKISDRQIDESVRSNLNALGRNFLENNYQGKL